MERRCFSKILECSLTVDAVAALKELDLGLVTDSQLSVEPTDLGILASDLGIAGHGIVVAAFHHEGTRCNEIAHLGVAVG